MAADTVLAATEVTASSAEEARALLLEVLRARAWPEAWRVWRESRHLLVEQQDKDKEGEEHREDGELLQQDEDDEVEQILTIYCTNMANTKGIPL